MASIDLNNIIRSLSYEYQSVWVVNLDDLQMQIFSENSDVSLPGAIHTALDFQAYDATRKWYVENNVALQDQKRLMEQTAAAYVIPRILDGKPFYIEYSRVDGSVTNYNQVCYSKYEPDGEPMKHFILAFRDIDVRKKMERDDLTGVYTRQFFFQKAEQLLKENPDKQFDLLISDIVDFKDINDMYGSAVGDEILRWTGTTLAASISEDRLVGRYAGDQFVLLSDHEFMQSVTALDERRGFAEQKLASGLPKTIVKYGVYENVDHNKSIISTCDKAHLALNSIKHQYGTYISYYDDTLMRTLDVEKRIESSMYEALESNQFKVYYQPKHDAETGALIGAEALIRWIHPEYGFMSPADFIPLFERNGFIVESDDYVWKRTCENLRNWMDKGLKVVPISVNASKITFAQNHLLEKLVSASENYTIDPSLLHLEITETLMTKDIDSLVEKLTAIRDYGYKVELDDFGSGYSSLNILSALPMDVVKLDMSFMRQFGDRKRTKVLAACIKLAKELGYETVSEGVETAEQCDLLAILGVDAIQGFYYSKPLPEEEFEQYLTEKIK